MCNFNLLVGRLSASSRLIIEFDTSLVITSIHIKFKYLLLQLIMIYLTFKCFRALLALEHEVL